MSKILVIGASGKIGKILLSKLSQTTHQIVAMVRDRNKCTFSAAIKIVEADLEGDIESVVKGFDIVIFTAGSGSATGLDKTFLIDLWGATKVVDAAKHGGVKHFIMVSSRGADNPDTGPEAIKPYLIAKHFADEYLINSGLCYTILRPGRLIDGDGCGLIKTDRPSDPNQQFISRVDTATSVFHCIENKSVRERIYELYQGDLEIKNVFN